MVKKEVSPGIIIGVIVIVLAVVGFFGYRWLNPDPNSNGQTKEQFEKNLGIKQARRGTTIMGTRPPDSSGGSQSSGRSDQQAAPAGQ